MEKEMSNKVPKVTILHNEALKSTNTHCDYGTGEPEITLNGSVLENVDPVIVAAIVSCECPDCGNELENVDFDLCTEHGDCNDCAKLESCPVHKRTSWGCRYCGYAWVIHFESKILEKVDCERED